MPRQNDLFPASVSREPRSDVKVTLTLHKHRESQGDKGAYLLSKTGMERDAQWIPKSVATPDTARDGVFTLPRSEALNRGWL